jgi:hypothetical protein
VNPSLKINPEFEKIIPELSEHEFEQLEENIMSDGVILNPIIVWEGVIIDGHKRYKIAQKHPEIKFEIYQKNFENVFEASAWICDNQLGRRNITEQYKRYLRGKRYNIEKDMRSFHGNRYTLPTESSLDENHPDYNEHGTRSRLAKDLGVTQWAIQSAADYANGVDAAEAVSPGIKKELLNGTINPLKKDVVAIAKLPPEERREAVEMLRIPKEEKRTQSEDESKEEDTSSSKTVELTNAQQPGHEIEESIINSMIGAVNIFIDSINNYLTRFPKLRTEEKYREQTKEIMMALRNYINDVEGALK